MKFRLNDNKIINLSFFCFDTIVVGSGAAGLNAADRLSSNGIRKIAIITEGFLAGTSRNTGSDKQTYYKMSLCGEFPDSISKMAYTLHNGFSMDGDIALTEAALSARCFFRLVELGVPFPDEMYGQFPGYKTDHDPAQRATSAGPLTSRYMVEKLEQSIFLKKIKIFNGYKAISILADDEKSYGILALNLNGLENKDERYVVFKCSNIVYATGGQGSLYNASVYPLSQTGGTGIALEAGVSGKNLTEWQYGIASVKFRWNLSGTYQQVIPRYISTDENGEDEREFLEDYFSDSRKLLDSIFLKGYEWPFDPRKLEKEGSSLIDLLVFHEKKKKGRRVFIDYTKNPSCSIGNNGKFDFSLLSNVAFEYLHNSAADFGTPIDRLRHMNSPAVELYIRNGINLENEYLEIDVCAQHNNGGLEGNHWWESNIKNFFPIGEVNGSHGVYRPGGAALNSGQVGGLRAAQYISSKEKKPMPSTMQLVQMFHSEINRKIEMLEQWAGCMGESNVIEIRKEIGNRMTAAAAHIRNLDLLQAALNEAVQQLENLPKFQMISRLKELPEAFLNYDLLICQVVYMTAMIDYISRGGKSRGSYLVIDQFGIKPQGKIPEEYRYSLDQGEFNGVIQNITYKDGRCNIKWRNTRPIPQDNLWFENIWNSFLNSKNMN